MRQSRAVVVALVRDEDLRLMRQAPEGGRVDDAVAVALERSARRRRRLMRQATTAPVGIGGKDRARNRIADDRLHASESGGPHCCCGDAFLCYRQQMTRG